MMLRRLLPLTTVAITAAALPLMACGSSKSGSSSAPGTAVTAQNFRFAPASLSGTPGSKLSVTISNKDTTEHNFTIKELGVDKDIKPGASVTVSFTPKSAGSYTFYCEYHRSQGMTGTLAVNAG